MFQEDEDLVARATAVVETLSKIDMTTAKRFVAELEMLAEQEVRKNQKD